MVGPPVPSKITDHPAVVEAFAALAPCWGLIYEAERAELITIFRGAEAKRTLVDLRHRLGGWASEDAAAEAIGGMVVDLIRYVEQATRLIQRRAAAGRAMRETTG